MGLLVKFRRFLRQCPTGASASWTFSQVTWARVCASAGLWVRLGRVSGRVEFVLQRVLVSSGRLVKSVSGCKGASWVKAGFQSQRRLVGQGIGQS